MSEGGRVRASVVCYHCGHTAGEIEAAADAPLATGVFVPALRPESRLPLNGRALRCARCHGPTYVENVRPVQVREPKLVTWRGRGRPPKNAIRITMPPEDGVKRRRPVVLYALVVDGDPATAAELLQRQAV
jgi:hypothetical protein